MLNIILEGCDKTGKTTLADILVKKFGFKKVVSGPPTGDPYVDYVKKLKSARQNTVFDRLCYGELVYGPIYRGKSLINQEKLRNLELLAMAKNTIVIFCHDNVKNLSRRFKRDGEKFSKMTDIKKISSSFKEIMRDCRLPVIHHQIGTNDLTRGNKLKKIIKRFSRDVPALDDVIGKIDRPRLLLVGDKRNTRGRYSSVGLPFDFGPSSRFLFNQLRSLTDDIAIMNSDHPRLRAAIMAIRPELIISLGKNAHHRLNMIGIEDHFLVPHPSYENRFHHHSRRFFKMLRDIINLQVNYDHRK